MGLFGRKKQNTENMPETVEKAVAEVSAESTNPGDMSLAVTAWCAVTSWTMRYPEMDRAWS